MQATPTTKKWSDIKGLAAVTMDMGKRVGTIDDFYLDIQTHIVPGFVVKTGLIGHRSMLTNAIQGIGDDALTFTNEDALIKEGDEPILKSAFKGRDILGYRVLSEGGTVVGTLGNIILSINLPQGIMVTGYELTGGLRERFSNRYPTFTIQQIVRYGQDVLVVPDAVAVELMK
ncbi:hypothetical protein KDA_32730 [Dictyobacter alpinus]|uniref:PRC-barrel domain-containing protein n=1 Tax=Dictyobacter alpinus TaxID=2014873 RepID=A0A402B8Y8_9CHLR|nr:PRC-barrel domain-containing protein [Dictyobacter alpinus]GCE27789.1 hypothetical protein KDA_32730 [Dictyobacter alpinus]